MSWRYIPYQYQLIPDHSDHCESIINQTTQIPLLTETTLTSILTIGRKLQQIRSLVTAKSVFSSLWSYYKRTEQQASEVAIEAAVSFSQTTMEIVQITQSSSTVVTQYDETLEEEMYELEEVFESVIILSSTMTTTFSNGTVTSSEKGSASLSTQSGAIITAETLSSMYVRQERWSDAINVITKALQVAWSTVVNGGKTVLPSRDYAVAITAARRLALCYFKQRQTNKAEQIHIRIFEACKVLGVQDNLFITAANELVEFYETTYQFDKAVEVLSNLYTLLKTNLKPNDAITIRTAYRIAKFCRELQKIKDAEKYFFEIVTALDDRMDVLQWDAIEAALALCSIHMELQQWEAARYFYSVLWKTFLAQAETYPWTENLVEDIFYGYFELLDGKFKVEYKTLLQVTAEFRDKSVKVFAP
ncbi:hypothetical protein B0J12DRAFT_705940 [Macrophomina phaseolina]|uniref:Tetratricopeptide-like helical n=1 Tax=Macrophomina phaseolina TaxID=35725 RepID=A0ABQ8FQN9_9PEZI|nr:hypothetical protein B0J12DRAFT_705940 [Macrophomina phaseolina]